MQIFEARGNLGQNWVDLLLQLLFKAIIEKVEIGHSKDLLQKLPIDIASPFSQIV